jgi:hypothetical protein
MAEFAKVPQHLADAGVLVVDDVRNVGILDLSVERHDQQSVLCRLGDRRVTAQHGGMDDAIDTALAQHVEQADFPGPVRCRCLR